MRRILKCAVLACSWSGTSCLEPICTVSVQLWTASPDRNALLSVRSCMMLRVNGDDLPAATSDQQHPLQSLCEDLQELHVWTQVKEKCGELRLLCCIWRWHSKNNSQSERKWQTMLSWFFPLPFSYITAPLSRCATVCISADERIQFSSPPWFLGGPGMFSSTSWAPWDLLTTTSFSFTAVCILLTLVWSLWKIQSFTLSIKT